MLGALVIVFREVLEAGLIIGIVLAATRGLPGRGHWVTLGVMAGCAGAGVVALFAEAISGAFEGAGQELLNATVLAAGVIDVLGNQLWDSSGYLPQNSLLGRLLHTLIGYTDRPTELQVIAYVATLVAMAALMRIAAPPRPVRAAA